MRSIALGLCDEAGAAALMKDVPGPFIRRGRKTARIKIALRDAGSHRVYHILTEISQRQDRSTEIIRQQTDPKKSFPWADIFVCGYGSQRTRNAQLSFEKYTTLNAVRSLFDYETSLQNPEVILLRQDPFSRERLEDKLLGILMLEGEDAAIHYPGGGVEIKGPWGSLPLDYLSDGYRSTSHWVLDLIGWLIYAHRFYHAGSMSGIVLIDELEQHLHPRWQRYIVDRLRCQFPNIQFITSTHTPLTAMGLADLKQATIFKLKTGANTRVTSEKIDCRVFRGKRADQVLTSPAFDLTTTRSAGSSGAIARYTELAGKERNEKEEGEFQQLSRDLEDQLVFGETSFEQTVEKAVRKTLDEMLGGASSKVLDLETKNQLRHLFREEVDS